MKQLTEMQQSYVTNRAAGLRQREAAVAAGYSATTADKQASALERREDIKKGIAKAKRAMRGDGVTVPKDDELTERQKAQQMPRAKYTDPVDFLTDMMNHKHMPAAMRLDAAKQLLPYKHARIAEKGKKESKKDRAAELSGGGKPGAKPKFATKRPPLRVVGGNG
jgi:phage terminase small subunit